MTAPVSLPTPSPHPVPLALRALRGTGREIESEIRGPSMGHTLLPGTRIRIRCDGADQAAKGAVIAFVRNEELVAHRLVARGLGSRARGHVVTCGDGTVVCDAPIAITSVLGTVIASHDGHDWHPIPDTPSRTGWRGLAAACLQMTVRCGLEIDARLAATLVRTAELARRAITIIRRAWRGS